MKNELTEAQTALIQLIESVAGDSIDAIGEPTESDGVIEVQFIYNGDTYDFVCDPELGTASFKAAA